MLPFARRHQLAQQPDDHTGHDQSDDLHLDLALSLTHGTSWQGLYPRAVTSYTRESWSRPVKGHLNCRVELVCTPRRLPQADGPGAWSPRWSAACRSSRPSAQDTPVAQRRLVTFAAQSRNPKPRTGNAQSLARAGPPDAVCRRSANPVSPGLTPAPPRQPGRRRDPGAVTRFAPTARSAGAPPRAPAHRPEAPALATGRGARTRPGGRKGLHRRVLRLCTCAGPCGLAPTRATSGSSSASNADKPRRGTSSPSPSRS